MSETRWNLPNLITVIRIVVSPAIFMMALSPGIGTRFAAFALFVAAALSDIWDGYLARKHGLITDLGKLLDPLADKLLVAVTFIPFYMISHREVDPGLVPWWGELPMWVMVVIFGREIFITVFRSYAARRGVIIAAGKSGKRKALLQALFIGGLMLWYPLSDLAAARGWEGNPLWSVWSTLHEAWVGLTLVGAVVLTVYSLGVYLWRYRTLLGAEE